MRTPPDAVAERVLELLRKVTGDADIGADLDVPLFRSGLLDSLGVVTLVLDVETAFGLEISPSDLDRTRWETPRALLADIERRLEEQA